MTATIYDPHWWMRPVPASRAAAVDKDSSVAFGALIAFTCILILAPQTWISALRPLRIAFLAASFGAGSLLWEQWRTRKGVRLNREVLICFAILVWAFVTIPLSYWPGGSVSTLTQLYSKTVVVFWLLANVITTFRRLRLLSIVLMLCTVPVAAVGLRNFLTGNFVPDTEVVARIVGYEGGLTANPNDLALMLNLLLPLSIALFFSSRRRSFRILCLAIIGLNAAAIIATFSRAGFLALMTIGAMYFVQMVRRRGADRLWALAIAFGVLLALPLLPASYVSRVSTVTNLDSDPTGSSQARWRDTVAAVRFVSQHPIIGAGIGMDALALNQIRGEEWLKVHNVYLEYAVDLGIPGVVLFLVLFGGIILSVRRSRQLLERNPQCRDLYLLARALEISLLVFAISGFFYPVAYQFYFYYIGGLALALPAVTRKALEALTCP